MKVFLVERNDNVLDDEFKGYVIMAENETQIIQRLPEMDWGNWDFNINYITIKLLGKQIIEVFETKSDIPTLYGYGFV